MTLPSEVYFMNRNAGLWVQSLDAEVPSSFPLSESSSLWPQQEQLLVVWAEGRITTGFFMYACVNLYQEIVMAGMIVQIYVFPWWSVLHVYVRKIVDLVHVYLEVIKQFSTTNFISWEKEQLFSTNTLFTAQTQNQCCLASWHMPKAYLSDKGKLPQTRTTQ